MGFVSGNTRCGVIVGIALAAVGLSGSRAAAYINVELRPSIQSVPIGSNVNFGLYVVSDSAASQGLAAAQIIFSWQPSYLQMLSNSNVGAVPMISSAFTSPDPYGVNESSVPQDGNAMYIGYAPFGNPVMATPAGTLLTTLRFHTLAATSLTPVTLMVSGGNPVGFTTVFDGTVPNLSVTGILTGAGVQVVPAPASVAALGVLGLGVQRRRRRVDGSRELELGRSAQPAAQAN